MAAAATLEARAASRSTPPARAMSLRARRFARPRPPPGPRDERPPRRCTHQATGWRTTARRTIDQIHHVRRSGAVVRRSGPSSALRKRMSFCSVWTSRGAEAIDTGTPPPGPNFLTAIRVAGAVILLYFSEEGSKYENEIAGTGMSPEASGVIT